MAHQFFVGATAEQKIGGECRPEIDWRRIDRLWTATPERWVRAPIELSEPTVLQTRDPVERRGVTSKEGCRCVIAAMPTSKIPNMTCGRYTRSEK